MQNFVTVHADNYCAKQPKFPRVTKFHEKQRERFFRKNNQKSQKCKKSALCFAQLNRENLVKLTM